MQKDEFRCRNAIGNGAGMLKCQLTHAVCPYQRWCHIKRLFEMKPVATRCKDFKEEK